MKHVHTIQAFIKTLMKSENFHALVLQSPPGWGKSTTIDAALADLGVNAVAAGSYATPLHIFNTLCRHPNSDSIVIFDDCAGIFSDPKSMAILKAATWQSSGQGGVAGPDEKARRVAWGSTSEKVEQPFVDFAGKLILLTNVVPNGKETEAFLSRCLSYRINIEPESVKEMLLAAAGSPIHFANPTLALEVARFLVNDSTRADLMKLNFRTLKMGYDLAETHPAAWRELFVHLFSRTENEDDSISQILQSGLPVREQEAKFLAITGKSRRTFYNYKRKLGLSRSYQLAAARKKAKRGVKSPSHSQRLGRSM